MAKAIHSYAPKRRPPKPSTRFAHRRLVADRDDDSIDVIAAPTPQPDRPEQVGHPG